ncbi:MAG TPA: mannose-6-phosphate isomerase, class I, partial [Jiangellaceae bacterium]|nr:mannose-6-phosphate isomerase, class I [Jiangellaceae bacterium]
GIVLALLLEPARLEPGQAVFVPDGVPHAYLSGLAVEVQANSDNTLRAGLTGKHVAPGRLMRVLDFGSLAAVPVTPHEVSPGQVDYPVAGVQEFALSRVRPGEAEVTLPAGGPWSVLCVEGQVTVATGADDGETGSRLSLGPGQAGFIPAAQHPSRVGGHGVAYVVTVPS